MAARVPNFCSPGLLSHHHHHHHHHHHAPPSFHSATIEDSTSIRSPSKSVDVHDNKNIGSQRDKAYSGFVLAGMRQRHLWCCMRSSGTSSNVAVVERATARQAEARVGQLKDCESGTAISEGTAATRLSNTSEDGVLLPLVSDQDNRNSNDTRYANLDAAGRLRTPRAARELALGILYAALTSKLSPMRIFEDRMRRREAFVKASPRDILEGYELSPADGAPIFVQDEGLAAKLEAAQEEEAITEAAVLTAPLTFVYNRFVLRMTQKILKATSDRWLLQEPTLKQLIPVKWKEEKGRLIERCILHMAIAEIELIGTSPSIVVNEAVELAKRMCDGVASRVINGCLGSYCRSRHLHKNTSIVARELETSIVARGLETSQTLLLSEDLG